MGYHVTTHGQLWRLQNDVDGATVDVGLYHDGTDDPGVTATLADIGTEPADVDRVSATLTATANDYVELTDETVIFDVTSAIEDVDAYLIVADGDLVSTGPMNVERDLSQIDELELEEVGHIFVAP